MQTASPRFFAAIRAPHTLVSTAQHRNLVTGAVTDLDIEDGTVTVDVNSRIRRTLDLTVPASDATWGLLDTPGGEITVRQGITFVDGTTETVPQGVFVVDQDAIGYGPGGTITLTCPDRWIKVQRNRFGLRRSSIAANLGWQEIKRLVAGAWPGSTYPFPGWSELDKSADDPVGALLWDDGDREAAILGLCEANGVEAFFDADGKAVLREIPVLAPSSQPDWTVDAGAAGVMIDADRTRDRSTVRNAIIVTTDATDITFLPVEVKNTTADDPLNVTGTLGYVAEDWSSASLRNSAQARKAGRKRLSRQLGTAKQLSLTAVGNPALDAEDIVAALLPQLDRGSPRAVEVHFVDSVTHPLTPSGTQTILTRSTRPDTDGT